MKQLRLSQVYGNNVCVGLLSKHRAATFSTAKYVVSAPSSGVKGAEEGGGNARWSARRSPSADREARGWNARRQHAPLALSADDIQIYGSSMRANGGLEMNEADLPAL